MTFMHYVRNFILKNAEAARRAHLDAFGANRGAPWRDPTNGG